MHILTGDTQTKKIVAKLQEVGIGRMFCRPIEHLYPNEKWGFDNGAYACWTNDNRWDGYSYMLKLERAVKLPPPYLAVIPDKPTQPDSMDFSLYWLDVVPQEWNWYFAIQEHMSFTDVEKYVLADDRVAGLFLGGTHRFKEEFGEEFLELAHSVGKKFHYARTSSMERMVTAYNWGCDSCDSSFFLYEYRRLDAVVDLIKNNFVLPPA